MYSTPFGYLTMARNRFENSCSADLIVSQLGGTEVAATLLLLGNYLEDSSLAMDLATIDDVEHEVIKIQNTLEERGWWGLTTKRGNIILLRTQSEDKGPGLR